MTASSGGCDVFRYLRTDRIIFAHSERQITGIFFSFAYYVGQVMFICNYSGDRWWLLLLLIQGNISRL